MKDINELLTQALMAYQGKDLDKAITIYRSILLDFPDQPHAMSYLGYLLHLQNKIDPALALTAKAAALYPREHTFLNNYGNVLIKAVQFDKAAEVLEKCVSLEPKNIGYMIDLAKAYRQKNMYEKTIDILDRCLALDPNRADVKTEKAICLLYLGDFAAAWPLFKNRFSIGQLKNFSLDTAELTSIDTNLSGKKVFIYGEQGFGDAIQFARFFPLLKQKGAIVYFSCRPELHELLRHAPGIDQLFIKGDAVPTHDYHIALFDLVALCTPTKDKIIPPAYFSVPERSLLPSALNTKAKKIGICWQGAPHNQNNRWRSCRLDDFAPLMELANTKFFSLQVGPAAKEIQDGGYDGVVENMMPFIKDFADTAAIIQKMDLMITIDTSIAHLTGTLNKPMWVVLSHNNDWRWERDVLQTAWYPSAKLYRPSAPDNWQGLFEWVKRDLTLYLNNK